MAVLACRHRSLLLLLAVYSHPWQGLQETQALRTRPERSWFRCNGCLFGCQLSVCLASSLQTGCRYSKSNCRFCKAGPSWACDCCQHTVVRTSFGSGYLSTKKTSGTAWFCRRAESCSKLMGLHGALEARAPLLLHVSRAELGSSVCINLTVECPDKSARRTVVMSTLGRPSLLVLQLAATSAKARQRCKGPCHVG